MADVYTTYDQMTTIFTPPASCVSSWTYEGTYYNTDPGGCLMQNLLEDEYDTSCWPEDFQAYGRADDNVQIYSPGACPVGYSTVQQSFDGATTFAVCCTSGFSYESSVAGINYDDESSLFHGCTSTYPSGDTTTVPARANDTDLSSGAIVSGPVLMWAQPITVAFREQDLTLFGSTASVTTSTSSNPSSSSAAMAASVPTTTSASQTASATAASVQSASPKITATSDALSGGAIAGIAVGAAAVLGILLGLAIFFRRKKSKATGGPPPWATQGFAAPPTYHEQNKEQYTHAAPQWDHTNAASQMDHAKPTQQWESAELDARYDRVTHELPDRPQ